ncbi:MAG: DNA topology modulation protein [Afipia sp.]
MQRVLVLGAPGSGKSTFARRLSALTKLPLISLDAIYWQPGWEPSDLVVFESRMKDAAMGDRWIMDGNYFSQGAGKLRRDRADTVVWFDLPRHVCMMGILIRVAKSYGRVRPEMAAGCPEQFDLEFFRYVWTYREKQQPALIAYLDDCRADQKLVRFTERVEADSYIADQKAASAGIH